MARLGTALVADTLEAAIGRVVLVSLPPRGARGGGPRGLSHKILEGPHARRRLELEERARWAGMLGRFLAVARTPTLENALGAADAAETLVATARSVRTIRSVLASGFGGGSAGG